MRNVADITKDLYLAKLAEDEAKTKRVALEMEMEAAIGVPSQWFGSKQRDIGEYKVKVSRKVNTTIDAAKLREVAAASGLANKLDTLFRWKPEIVKKEWDAAPQEERDALAPAITNKAGKTSFVVTLIDKGE